MLIRLGYDIHFEVAASVPMTAHRNVHPSRTVDLVELDQLRIEPAVGIEQYQDSFGNLTSRLLLPPGRIRLHNSFLIEDSGEPDLQDPGADEVPIDRLPAETLRYLLASRYCEVGLLLDTATELFGNSPRGRGCVQAICDWVNQHVTFGYEHARSSKTALEVYNERLGVCRYFQHLAVIFRRCLNIPARYATGYLDEIGVLPRPPMDFSAWFEAFLYGRWWTFDARHNARASVEC